MSKTSLDDVLPGYGAGLRFRMIEEYRINVRGDYGWGQDDQASTSPSARRIDRLGARVENVLCNQRKEVSMSFEEKVFLTRFAKSSG